MHRLLAILVFTATTSALPQMSMAQNSEQTQASMPMQQRVKQDLEQEGFTDVRIMVSSFLVRARDKHGNPVMMVINPDSVTAVTAIPGSAQRFDQGSSKKTVQGSADRLGLSMMMIVERGNGSISKSFRGVRSPILGDKLQKNPCTVSPYY